MKDEGGCNCRSEEEHQALVYNVDESFKRDNERARIRHERTSFVLRANVISAKNGFTSAE